MQTAKIKWIAREEFQAALPSGHTVPFDTDRKHNTGPGPMEMLLGALGACTSVDVVSILEKKSQKLSAPEIENSRERPPPPPSVCTKIERFYRRSGQLEEKAVRDAIELSQIKYCAV